MNCSKRMNFHHYPPKRLPIPASSSLSQPISCTPKPSPTPHESFHQLDAFALTHLIHPPSAPYFAAKISNHSQPWPICNIQHHFRNISILNSLIFFSPKPPNYLLEHILPQWIQIILWAAILIPPSSSTPPPPPPHKKGLNSDSTYDMIHVGALKKGMNKLEETTRHVWSWQDDRP